MKQKIKVCSFVPAATSMIIEMGFNDMLSGVTFECPSNKPKVIRSYLEDNHFTSEEIEKIVSESKRMGKSLYYVDEELLAAIAPDIIFTQNVCDVCQIGSNYAQKAIYKLAKQPEVVDLTPRSLDDVYANLITVARTLGREEAAYQLLAQYKKRADTITDVLRDNNDPLKRVMVMEWIDPIYNCGHWIPYQVALAGGVDMLSNPSGYSIVTPWEKIRQYDPEVLVIAPCGFSVSRSLEEAGKLTCKEGWFDLTAVRQNAVYLVDAELFTCPGTRLIEGIEVLASLFHPKLFPFSRRFQSFCVKISTDVDAVKKRTL
jgi:iron complex transport system substrate-binding protein